ncbi:hypothetical protein PoB_006125000 [Plakobranchus ocellatus]|uniref:CUB domain-containing protein n=1 Tax=Plakobranchus ocellatus TaxID=259542 RepID=A0AAV4CSB5_9GAST|nr:hypothetical protein PoB_006125000 [Plakobranchus ocellatus]
MPRDADDYYPHNVDCPFFFRAARPDWKLMMRVLEMDIPDRTRKGVCKDALYVYDAATYVTKAMSSAMPSSAYIRMAIGSWGEHHSCKIQASKGRVILSWQGR